MKLCYPCKSRYMQLKCTQKVPFPDICGGGVRFGSGGIWKADVFLYDPRQLMVASAAFDSPVALFSSAPPPPVYYFLPVKPDCGLLVKSGALLQILDSLLINVVPETVTKTIQNNGIWDIYTYLMKNKPSVGPDCWYSSNVIKLLERDLPLKKIDIIHKKIFLS